LGSRRAKAISERAENHAALYHKNGEYRS
jgi:hypothetical protein